MTFSITEFLGKRVLVATRDLKLNGVLEAVDPSYNVIKVNNDSYVTLVPISSLEYIKILHDN